MKLKEFLADAQILSDDTIVISRRLYNRSQACKKIRDDAGVEVTDLSRLDHWYMRHGFDDPGEFEDGAFFLAQDHEKVTNFHYPVWIYRQ